MLTKHQGFEKVFSIASTNFIHQDYDRTTKLHRMYKAFITGEDADYLLHRFNLREDETMFAQRIVRTTNTPLHMEKKDMSVQMPVRNRCKSVSVP